MINLLSEGTSIKDTQTDIVYELHGTTALNFGTYSVIWEVRPSSDNDQYSDQLNSPESKPMDKAVAKIGRFTIDESPEGSNASPEIEKLKPLFEKELTFVQKLREESGQRFVPMMHKACLLEPGQKILERISQDTWKEIPVLLMEYVDKDWLLSKQIEPGKQGLESEQLAIESGYQYAELLSIIHSGLTVVCGDRKVDDFYWDPDNKKLYVLDWNVYDKLDDDDTGESRDGLIKRDIRLFGQIWLQFLAHKDLEELPVDNPATGTPWDDLRRGTRRLLRSTLKNDKGFEHAEGVKNAWKEWADCLGKDRTALLQEAKDLTTEKTSAVMKEPVHWRNRTEKVRDLVDLVTFQGDEDFSTPDGNLLATVEKWLAGSDNRFSSLITLYQDNLKDGHYKDTEEKLDDWRRDDAISRERRLQASRLYLVAKVLVEELQQEGTVSEQLKNNLLKADGCFTKRAFADARATLQEQPKSRTEGAFHVLQADAQFNTWLSDAKSSDDLKSKQRYYQNAKEALDKIRRNDAFHAQILQGTTAISLQNTIDKLGKEIRQEGEKEHVRKTEETISNKLSKAAQADPPYWPLSVEEEPLKELPEQSEVKRQLTQITRRLQHGMDSRVLESVLEVANAVESGHSNIAQALRKLSGKLALYELEERKKQAYDVYRIQDMLRFAQWLENHRDSLSLSDAADIKGKIKRLRDAKKCLGEIRESLDSLDDPWTGSLKQEIIRNLDLAKEYGVRFVSTKWGEISIGSLLLENGVRESEQKVKKINEKLGKLDQSIQKPITSPSHSDSAQSPPFDGSVQASGITSEQPLSLPEDSQVHLQETVSQQMKDLLPEQLRQYRQKELKEKLEKIVEQLKNEPIDAFSLEHTLDEAEQFILGERKSQEEITTTLSEQLKTGFDNLMSVSNVMEEYPVLLIQLGLLHYKTQRDMKCTPEIGQASRRQSLQ